MKTSRRTHRRGTILALTMVLALAMVITTASYLSMTTTAYKTTQANQTQHNLLPVGERGIDEAMHTLYRYVKSNQNPDGTWILTPDLGMWSRGGWVQLAANSYSKDFYTQPINVWGASRYTRLKVVVRDVPSLASPALMPNVISDVTFLGSDSSAWGADKSGGNSYTRQFGAWLRTRSTYANSMVGIKAVTVSGGVFTADSYKSALGGYTGFYSSANPGDKATIATLSTLDDAISTGSITVRGYVVTGGDNPIDDIAGSHVYGYSATPATYAYASTGIDPTRIARDFNSSVNLVPAPAVATVPFPAGVTAGGTTTYTLGPGTYRLSAPLSLNGSDIVNIVGDTTIIADTGASVSTSGSASFSLIGAATKLTVYTPANFTITGNGIVNGAGAAAPKNVTVYGTNPTAAAQLIKMAGNAAFSGTIYAPKATVEIKGGGASGAFYGAVIGYTIKATGGTNFHYDESLSTIADPSYMLNAWLELTGSGKVAMSAYGL